MLLLKFDVKFLIIQLTLLNVYNGIVHYLIFLLPNKVSNNDLDAPEKFVKPKSTRTKPTQSKA